MTGERTKPRYVRAQGTVALALRGLHEAVGSFIRLSSRSRRMAAIAFSPRENEVLVFGLNPDEFREPERSVLDDMADTASSVLRVVEERDLGARRWIASWSDYPEGLIGDVCLTRTVSVEASGPLFFGWLGDCPDIRCGLHAPEWVTRGDATRTPSLGALSDLLEVLVERLSSEAARPGSDSALHREAPYQGRRLAGVFDGLAEQALNAGGPSAGAFAELLCPASTASGGHCDARFLR